MIRRFPIGILILKEPSWVGILLSSERKNFQTMYSNKLYWKKIKIYVYGVHNRPRLCHSFLLLGRLTLRSTHEVHLLKRLTGLKYAIKIEDNEVDELKPKVFNLVVIFNMFNWKENSTKEYGKRETKMNDALEPATSRLSQYLILWRRIFQKHEQPFAVRQKLLLTIPHIIEGRGKHFILLFVRKRRRF